MKTTAIIFAALLTLQVSTLFAGTTKESVPASSESYTITLASLAPVTPAEATFEENTVSNDYTSLVPSLPAEASFDDASCNFNIPADLAPQTPGVAGFDDDETNLFSKDLAPVIPMAADFE